MADQKITALTVTTLIDDADVLVMAQSPFGAGSNRKFTGSTLRTQLGFTTGILGQAAGGTGIDTSAVTDGQLLIGGTASNDLQLATLTGTADQVIVTNGTNSITLSLPQSIATGSGVEFDSIRIAGKVGLGSGTINTANLTTGVLASSNEDLTIQPTLGFDVRMVLSGAGDFIVNTNDLVVDTSSGNVGINITNPADRLHIDDTTGVANQLRVSGSAPAINMHTSAGDISRLYVETTAGQITSGTSVGDCVLQNLDGRIHFGPSGGTVRLIMSGTNIDVTNTANLRILSGTSLSVLSGGTLNVNSGATFTTRTITTTSGELTITPFAGSNLDIALSSTGNFAINTSTFFVDGNQLRVGIGTATPPNELFILKSGVQITPNADTMAVFQSGADTAIDIVAGNASIAALKFGDVDNVQIGRIEYDHSANSMELYTNNSARVQITSGGNVGIGLFPTADELFHPQLATNGDSILALFENSQANAGASTNETAQIRWGFGGDNDVARILVGKEGDYTTGANSDSFMAFYTDLNATATERMRLSSAGLLSLTFPGGDAIRLNGSSGTTATITFAPNGASSNASRIQATTSGANTDLDFLTGGSSRMIIEAGGDVGIGTEIPSKRCQIHNTVSNNNLIISNTTNPSIIWSIVEAGTETALIGRATSNDSFTTGALAGDWIFRNSFGTGSIRWATTASNTLRMTLDDDGGLFMAGATGGTLGAGTINATGVFDDGVLLTCYVLEQYVDNDINMTNWDAKGSSPFQGYTQPGPEDDPEAFDYQPIYGPQKHIPAKRFKDNLTTYTDVEVFCDYVCTYKHLPSFDSFDNWTKSSIGDVLQRTWEALELQTVHIDQLLKRIKLLEAA